MNQKPDRSGSGRRKQPHTVIIARGDRVRHFTIGPWLAAIAGTAVVALVAGGVGAATYIGLAAPQIESPSRPADIYQAYEDRIAALRAQLDRVTSRQMIDQRDLETRVADLIARQSEISERQGRITPLIARMEGAPTVLPDAAPTPSPRPDLSMEIGELRLAAAESEAPVVDSLRMAGEAPQLATRSDAVIAEIDRSLRSIESDQMAGVHALAENTYSAVDRIADVLEKTGIDVTPALPSDASGGPYLPIAEPLRFEHQVRDLDAALDALEDLKSAARRVPVFHPAPGQQISSRFGVRRDPLLGTPAQHSGVDFRARTGVAVTSAAAGRVVFAGWNGGYGRMVEIDHGNGFTTRYAHMSRITVAEGAEVQPGDTLGKVGSSGRSTGPHLHFEVRRDGDAIDPMPFIRAGNELADLI